MGLTRAGTSLRGEVAWPRPLAPLVSLSPRRRPASVSLRCRADIGVEAHSTLRNKAAETAPFLPPHPQAHSEPLVGDPQAEL